MHFELASFAFELASFGFELVHLLDLSLHPYMEDFKMTNNDELGRVRNLGHDQSTAAPGHVYGVPSRRFEEWGARRLLKVSAAVFLFEFNSVTFSKSLTAFPAGRLCLCSVPVCVGGGPVRVEHISG